MPPHDNAVTSRGSKSNSIFNSNAGVQLSVYGLNKNDSRSLLVGPGKPDCEVETPFHSESQTAKKRKEKTNLTQH